MFHYDLAKMWTFCQRDIMLAKLVNTNWTFREGVSSLLEPLRRSPNLNKTRPRTCLTIRSLTGTRHSTNTPLEHTTSTTMALVLPFGSVPTHFTMYSSYVSSSNNRNDKGVSPKPSTPVGVVPKLPQAIEDYLSQSQQSGMELHLLTNNCYTFVWNWFRLF